MTARTDVPVVTPTKNGSENETAGTALDPTNHHSIVATAPENHLLIQVAEGTAVKTVTVKAGTTAFAIEAGLGDLVVSPSTTVRTIIGPFESQRFEQSDGTVHLDLEAAAAGTIWAYELPK